MRRYIAGFATLALISSTATVQADWPWKHTASIDKQRNNAWPQPFRSADSAAVIAPFDVMRNNGWKEHNTLGSIVFTEDQDLSDAGRLKVEWIVTHAPESHRVIYVKSGETTQATETRIESVQLVVSQFVPTGPLPQILVTNIEPPTSSGSYQNLINRALIRTTPAPRIPAFTNLNTPSAQKAAPNAKQDGGTTTGGSGK